MKNDVLDDLTVVKRSGQRVKFNASKIAIAIKKAFENTYEETNEKEVFKVFAHVLTYINDNYKDRKTISVEDVQDIIENNLKTNNNEVYITFSEYRKKRSASRQVFNERQQHKFVKAIEKVQNYDKSGSLLVPDEMINQFGRIISCEYAKSYLLDNKYVRLIEEGNIYIHDLEYFSLGVFSHYNYKCGNEEDILDLFLNLKELEHEINGIIAITNIDLKLSKFIIDEYKKILKNDLKKHFEVIGFIDFINFKKYEDIISRMSAVEDTILLEQFETNENLKLIIEKVILNSKEDLKKYIINIVKNLFKILKSNKNTYNLFLSNSDNFIHSQLKNALIDYLNSNQRIDNVVVMFNHNQIKDVVNLILENKNIIICDDNHYSDGLKINDDGELVVASTSIDLARLGLKFKNKDLKLFYDELDQLLELTKNQLLLVFEHIGNKLKNNYRILFNNNVLDDDKLDGNQKIRKVIKSGSLNIGLIGLIECSNLLNINIFEILKYIKSKLDIYTNDNKIEFNLFEPTDFKAIKYLMGIDKSIYGIVKEVTDKDYFLTIDNYLNDYKEFSKLDKYFDGIKYDLNLNKNISHKKLIEILDEMRNIKVIRIKVGKI